MTSASPLAARLLCRLQLSVPQLMADFPPHWQNSNKQRIFDAVHRPASLDSTVPCIFSRYQSQPQLPRLLPLQARATVHSQQQDVYSYPAADNLPPVSGAVQSSASPVVWHVNFADSSLFGFYSSALFAQDELQVSEHPCLASLVELLRLAAREWGNDADDSKRAAQPYTAVAQGYSDRIITPCLIMNARREASLDCDELYGHKLQSASAAVLSRAVHPISPPSFSHIIAMSAPTPRGEGSRYSLIDLQRILNTALTAFTAAVSESEHYLQQPYAGRTASQPADVVIHTGNWGCGGHSSNHHEQRHCLPVSRSHRVCCPVCCAAFGGNPIVMALLQMAAAQAAGVARLVYHTVESRSSEAYRAAEKQLHGLLESSQHGGSIDLDAVVSGVYALKLQWGRSNGT